MLKPFTKITLNCRYLYLLITIVHIGISIYAFNSFFTKPNEILFNNTSDGLKNYFTLYTYVKDPVGKDGLFKYDRFQYPYGDYVYATDNTPVFSIPFRWFCNNVKDVSGYTIIIFNLFIILNIIICGPLVFYIFRNIINSNLFAFISAIVLPWINIQLPRIWNGHFNLSFFSLVLAALCMLIAWHKNRNNTTRLWQISILMVCLCFYSFLQHGYYIAIITIFISATLFTYGILNRKASFSKAAFISSILIPLFTLGFAVGLLYSTDGYLSLRSQRAEGYDYLETKTRISSLFTPYSLHQFYFPVRGMHDGNHEHAAYLGNISLYMVLIIVLLITFKPTYRQRIKDIQKDFFKDKFKLAMVIGGLIMLSISMGEVYYTGPDRSDGYIFYNILNPFFYFHQLTDYVEQFRALSRFNWPFFLVFNVWAIYTITELYKQHGKNIQRLIIVAFILIGYVELKDFINELRNNSSDENLLSTKSVQQEFKPLTMQTAKYQAIMPIPFYTAGSENYNYTIDDYELWSKYTYQLSLYTDLPLMASRMSRTPFTYTKSILDLFAYDRMDSTLNQMLNKKPILIVTNKTYVEMNLVTPANDTAKVYYFAINNFIERHHLKPVDSMYHDVFFYEWYPKQ